MTTIDYKTWIQNRAEEIAIAVYGREFYDLPEYIHTWVYEQAMEAYKDHVADQIDNAHDREKYGKVKL